MKKKKLVIDCSSIQKKRNGINRYTLQIVDKFKDLKNFDIYLVSSSKIFSLKKSNFKKITEFDLNFFKIFFFQIYIFLYLIKIKPDLYWSPNHRLPLCLFFFNKIKKIVTIHDLCYLNYPQYMKFFTKILDTVFINFSIFIADKIITVSNSIKYEIIKKFNISNKKIQTIYSGSFIKKKFFKTKFKDKIEYLLFVGTIEPRKNIKNLIKGFNLFYKNNLLSNIHLFIAGNKGWDKENYFLLLNGLECRNNVKFLINPSDDELNILYKYCLAHINASYYEGFGLPIVEAMSYNKISILSSIPAYKELTNNNFLYFNPSDVQDISAKINLFITNKMYKKKVNNIFKKKFSWAKATKKLNNLFINI
jgi:glycosyltransferase involved in cell wall biosynthesis